MDISLTLKTLVSQRLLRRANGPGRTAVAEILLNTPTISDLIFRGKVAEVKAMMEKGRELGMRTFDQALFNAFQEGHVGYEEALSNADSINDLHPRIRLPATGSGRRNLAADTERLQIL